MSMVLDVGNTSGVGTGDRHAQYCPNPPPGRDRPGPAAESPGTALGAGGAGRGTGQEPPEPKKESGRGQESRGTANAQ